MFSKERFVRFRAKYELVREIMRADNSLTKEQAIALAQATMEYDPADEADWAKMFQEVGLQPGLAGAFTKHSRASHAA